MRRCGRFSVRKFAKDCDGSSTIEAMLWIPIVFSLFLLVINASVIYYRHSLVLRVVQDVNRAYSIGDVGSTEDAETLIEQRVNTFTSGAVANSVHDEATGILTSSVQIPIANMAIVGGFLFNVFQGFNIGASSQHFVED